jgi:hypothetical protein
MCSGKIQILKGLFFIGIFEFFFIAKKLTDWLETLVVPDMRSIWIEEVYDSLSSILPSKDVQEN